jgi:hypothetical protein
VKQNVAANSSFEVTATFTWAGNATHIVGEADPTNTLGEAVVVLANNSKSVDVAARLARQFVEFQKAQRAGAQFIDSIQSAPTLCTLKQVDGTDDRFKYASLPRGVIYIVNCTGKLTGGTADFESFKNFTLKNGWKIKEVQTFTGENHPQSGQSFAVKPAIGSTDPDTKFHIWADHGGWLEVVVAILIEGPECTDPYR